QRRRKSFACEAPNTKRHFHSKVNLTIGRQLLCVVTIKKRMPLLPLQQSALQRLILTPNPLPADLPVSTGLLGSRCGMSAQSLMVRIILLPHAYSPKHGAKFYAIRRPRWSSPFSRTKTCPGSAKRSRQLLTRFFFQRSEANAPLTLKN